MTQQRFEIECVVDDRMLRSWRHSSKEIKQAAMTCTVNTV